MSYKVINHLIQKKKLKNISTCIEFTNEFWLRFFMHVITILVKVFIDEQILCRRSLFSVSINPHLNWAINPIFPLKQLIHIIDSQ